jgi:NTP pyrophosphatase (non-canonical NTP hydrolase)
MRLLSPNPNPKTKKSMTTNRTQFNAIKDVVEERKRQEAKWGEQNHAPIYYLAILTEEVGEFAKECLTDHFGKTRTENLRVEAVQVAAVALAIIECLDRNPK